MSIILGKEYTAREYVKDKNIDMWYDKIYVKHLIKEMQKLDSGIGAILYPETKIIIFLWDGIIVHKMLLNEYNQDTLNIKDHVEETRKIIHAMQSGIIPASTMNSVRKQAAKLNLNLGKQLHR